MRKICVVVASRANYGRIKSVLTAIKEREDLELILVVGASALLWRFGMVIDVIRSDGFEPNAKVYMVIEGENPVTMAKSTGLAIVELATIFENLKPDIVLTVGDRYETLATAVAASYMNITVAHTQGGELTGSIDESVRHAITKLSHIHFVATDQSADRVKLMGEDPSYIFNTGCPAIDIISTMDLSLNGLIHDKQGVGTPVDCSKDYLLVMQHPVTTEFGNGYKQIEQTIKAIHELNMPTIWLWPNVDAGSDDISKALRVYRENGYLNTVQFFRNFSVENYARILNNAKCAIGNSSSFLRESVFMGTPSVIVGTRQAGRERGENTIFVDYNCNEIVKNVKIQINHGKYPRSDIYGHGDAGKKIAELLTKLNPKIQKKFYPI